MNNNQNAQPSSDRCPKCGSTDPAVFRDYVYEYQDHRYSVPCAHIFHFTRRTVVGDYTPYP